MQFDFSIGISRKKSARQNFMKKVKFLPYCNDFFRNFIGHLIRHHIRSKPPILHFLQKIRIQRPSRCIWDYRIYATTGTNRRPTAVSFNTPIHHLRSRVCIEATETSAHFRFFQQTPILKARTMGFAILLRHILFRHNSPPLFTRTGSCNLFPRHLRACGPSCGQSAPYPVPSRTPAAW